MYCNFEDVYDAILSRRLCIKASGVKERDAVLDKICDLCTCYGMSCDSYHCLEELKGNQPEYLYIGQSYSDNFQPCGWRSDGGKDVMSASEFFTICDMEYDDDIDLTMSIVDMIMM